MRQIPADAGIDPTHQRASSTWAQFLRSQADVLLGCDFFETVTLTGVRIYVLVVIEHAQRRIHILGATPHPATTWVTQAARNLVMDLQDASFGIQFLIRYRDGKFPHLFDAILADNIGIQVILSGIQMPKMNSIIERWIQTCRHELFGRHRSPAKTRSSGFTFTDAHAWAAPSTSTTTPPDHHGSHFRQVQGPRLRNASPSTDRRPQIPTQRRVTRHFNRTTRKGRCKCRRRVNATCPRQPLRSRFEADS